MYRYEDLRDVHLEMTTRCNASCPQCARNVHGGAVNPNLPDAELTLDDIRTIKSLNHMRQQVADMKAKIKKIDANNYKSRNGRYYRPPYKHYPKLEQNALKWTLGHWSWNKREKVLKEIARGYEATAFKPSKSGVSRGLGGSYFEAWADPLNMMNPLNIFVLGGADWDREGNRVCDRDDRDDRDVSGADTGNDSRGPDVGSAVDGSPDNDSRAHS